MSNVNQNKLAGLGIPPSRANGLIITALISPAMLAADLRKVGLTAEEIAPIDWRKKASLVHVKNQANCGDCWAQSSTSALSDRFIIKKGIKNLDLNPLITTQCASNTINQGCFGDSPVDAGMYFESKGAIDSSDNCPPWESICNASINCGTGLTCSHNQNPCQPELPQCDVIVSKCTSNNPSIYYAKKGSTRTTAVHGNSPGSIDGAATITRIKQELMNGPIVMCYMVPNDFYAPAFGYKWKKTNGIYINGAYNDELDSVASTDLKNALGIKSPEQWADIIIEGYAGGSSGEPQAIPAAHAVELVGWDIGDAGSYGRVPYWIIKNSWGPEWNENGYFRVAMNDPSANKQYNQLLGFDIPVFTMVQASTGRTLRNMGEAFGSCTVFDPDLDSGDSHNTVLPEKEGAKKKKKLSTLGLVLIITLPIAIAILVIALIKLRRR